MPNYSDFKTSTIQTLFKAANYTAKPNEYLWVDSSSSALTMTLPASPGIGANVRVGDASQNAAVNPITVARNGNTINGLAEDFVIDENNGVVDFVWTGTTWSINVPMFGTGGLTEAQVDSLIVSGTSGLHSWFLRPGGELHDGTDITVTELSLTSSAGRIPVFSMPHSGFPAFSTQILMPAKWDEGSFQHRMVYITSSTNVGTVIFNLEPGAVGDGESFSNFAIAGSAQITDTTGGVTNQLRITPWSNAYTIPDAGPDDLLWFDWYRLAASDTFTGIAYLVGVQLRWTSNAPTDD